MGVLDRIRELLDPEAGGSNPTGVESGGGALGYFGLADWWEETFTPDEQELIQERYQPMGSSRERPLTQGQISHTTQTAAGLLWALAGWFNKPGERHLARRILEKAEQVADGPLDRHFTYQQQIEVYYPDREDPEAMAAAVRACERQVALSSDAAAAFQAEYPDSSLPAHRGFKQLAIIYDKQGRYDEAITLCRRVQAEGWSGDWEKRLDRLQAKGEREA